MVAAGGQQEGKGSRHVVSRAQVRSFYYFFFFFIANYYLKFLLVILNQKLQERDPNDGVTVVWVLGLETRMRLEPVK